MINIHYEKYHVYISTGNSCMCMYAYIDTYTYMDVYIYECICMDVCIWLSHTHTESYRKIIRIHAKLVVFSVHLFRESEIVSERKRIELQSQHQEEKLHYSWDWVKFSTRKVIFPTFWIMLTVSARNQVSKHSQSNKGTFIKGTFTKTHFNENLLYCFYFKVLCRLFCESLTNTNTSNLTEIP